MELIVKENTIYADSRDVAEMVGKRHDHLIRDIDGYMEALNQNPNLGADNFFVESTYKSGTGKLYKCYLLTQMGCEVVANKLTGQKGVLFTAAYVKQFNEMKEKLAFAKLPDFTNPSIAARAWADQYERREIAEAKIRHDAPLVAYSEAVQNTDTNISVREMAKILCQSGVDIGEKRLYAKLREDGLVVKGGRDKNLPTQTSTHHGWFVRASSVIGNQEFFTARVTPKGRIYLLERYGKHGTSDF